MKLAGILLVIVSAGSVGLQLAFAMKTRYRMLRQLLSAVEILKNEIVVCATPLPQAFAMMASSLNGSMGKVFSGIAHEMNKRRWMTVSAAMEQAISGELSLKREEELCDLFRAMAAGLGKYDKDSQISTLDITINRVKKMIDQAEQERSVKSKTYELLGFCTGLSIAILLI